MTEAVKEGCDYVLKADEKTFVFVRRVTDTRVFYSDYDADWRAMDMVWADDTAHFLQEYRFFQEVDDAA